MNSAQPGGGDTPYLSPSLRPGLLLLINSILFIIGCCGTPLIARLYFTKNGKRVWFASWLETVGWPIILLPILANYVSRRKTTAGAGAKIFCIKTKLFLSGAGIGLLTGLIDYLYTYGVSKIPVSTSSLIIASQLAFTSAFCFFLVKQKFTAYSINAVVLLTTGAAVLALHVSGDRPKGESNKDYWMGFIMTLLAAMLYGLVLPLMELSYMKAGQTMSYNLILEFQMVMGLFATAICTVGMIVNKDFQAIHKEAKGFELGVTKYYLVIFFNVIMNQSFFVGVVGVIYYSSSLFSGVLLALLLPPTEILAVVFFHEKFQIEKCVSLFLSLWGFISYFYGEYKALRDRQTDEESKTTNIPTKQIDQVPMEA